MDMEARRAFAASQQEVWDALEDPELLKACVPGCEHFEVVGAGHYALDLVLKLGAGAPRFRGNLQWVDCFAPERYQLEFDGDGGVAGNGKGVGRARLIPLADYAPGHPRCQLHYSVSADLDGNIAKLDPRLVEGAAQALADHFFRRFDEQLRRRYPRAAPADPGAGAQEDLDADERAGAPTMLLDRSARAPATQRPKAASKARFPLRPVVAALAGVAVLVLVYWFTRTR